MYFDINERNYLNKIALDITLEECVDNITLSLGIAIDEDVVSLLSLLLEKLKSMSNDDWNKLQENLPFATYYTESDYTDD